MAFSWVRPKQAPDDEIEVFGLGEPDAEDDTGEILQDRYELLEVLACGATATVYRARDLTTKSIVAVKVLYKGAQAAVGEFFNQEARLAARIRSPHLVHASHFGEDDGRPFIVFDLVPGEALSELYCEKLMPWRELFLVVLDLLAALAELHRRGITHRDVKPDNVFVLRTLDQQVHVTLLDLGFAAVPPERRITGAPEPSRKVFGTYGFIAPEMLAGSLPEPRGDLYSVGALMYVMLTGQQVPDLRAAPDLICIPSPRVFVPSLPDAVDALVMRALSDIDARFQSAAEMAVAVRTALAVADAGEREAAVHPATEPSPPTTASLPSSIVPDDEMRPFREAPAVKTARPEEPSQGPRAVFDTQPAAPRQRSADRWRIGALTMGSGLIGVLCTWGIMRGHEPRELDDAAAVRTPANIIAAPVSQPGVLPSHPASSPALPAAPPPSASELSPPPSTNTPSPAPSGDSKGGAVVAAAIRPPKASTPDADSSRPASRKPSGPRASTFAQVMTRLEPRLRACAREAGFAETPTTVQVRSDPVSGSIDSVRVLKLSSQHPFAACVGQVVRSATLPPNVSLIEDFTFFQPRGEAAG
jgi:eukaryotic-like serine/threonine-protein kinase